MPALAIRCETPSQIREVFAARRRQLGLNQLELDDLAGTQSAYAGKCEIGTRNYGNMSLSSIMGALGLEMIVVERPEVRPSPAKVWGSLRENLDRLGLDLLVVEKPRPRALPKPLSTDTGTFRLPAIRFAASSRRPRASGTSKGAALSATASAEAKASRL
jgi:hypothetical protein